MVFDVVHYILRYIATCGCKSYLQMPCGRIQECNYLEVALNGGWVDRSTCVAADTFSWAVVVMDGFSMR